MATCVLESLKYYLFNEYGISMGKSSPIQKGLIPSLNGGGGDLCEEGLGFGVPILQYVRDFYFPGSAITLLAGPVDATSHVAKKFNYDLIERKQTNGGLIQSFS